MKKILFKDYPDITTPISSDNLNLMQGNIEEEINNMSKYLVYMTSEEVIGQWINNKPIYRRIFSGTIPTLNPTGWVNLFQVADVEIPLRTYGLMVQNGANYYEIPRYENTNYFMEFSYEASTGYYRTLGNGWSGQGYIIIVEYTKTTD